MQPVRFQRLGTRTPCVMAIFHYEVRVRFRVSRGDAKGQRSEPTLNELFTHIGLLSESQREHVTSNGTLRAGSLIPRLQDDFPDVSELLKAYPEPNATHVDPTTSQATQKPDPPLLSRPTVCATTYDGKRIFFKRKTRSKAIVSEISFIFAARSDKFFSIGCCWRPSIR
jgi:hypothetical protein